MKNGLKCLGLVEIVDKKTGEILHKGHNMFTNIGLSKIAAWLAGATNVDVPSVIKVGSSNTAPALGQTTLMGTVLGVKPVESKEATGPSVLFITTFNEGEGSGVWEELGMFDDQDQMWSRALTGTYTKKDLDKIEIHWTYQLYDNSEVE